MLGHVQHELEDVSRSVEDAPAVRASRHQRRDGETCDAFCDTLITEEATRSAPPSLIDQTGQVISFAGTFRLPFSRADDEGRNSDFYLADDGTPIHVRQQERDLGFPLVRLEVTFGP